jgi:hypothetical protein
MINAQKIAFDKTAGFPCYLSDRLERYAEILVNIEASTN